MRAMFFRKTSVLTASSGLGVSLAGILAYNAATPYVYGDTCTTSIGGVTANWLCNAAAGSTGNAPPIAMEGSSAYWIRVDSNGIPTKATSVLIQVETNAIRWRDDGVAPTAAIGNLLPPSSATAVFDLIYAFGYLGNVKLIQVAVSATANVTFYQA